MTSSPIRRDIGPDDAGAPADDADAGAAVASYVRAVRAHPWVIVATTVAAVAACAVFVRGPLSYESTAEVLVTPLPPGDRSFVGLPLPRAVGDPVRAVDTAAAIVNSPEAAKDTAHEIGGLTDADVRANVTVEPAEQGNVVDVTAKATDPEMAARLANRYTRASLAIRQEDLREQVREELRSARLELSRIPDPTGEAAEVLRSRIADLRSIRDGSDPTLSLAQPGAPPLTPAGKPRWLLLALALIAGMVLGTVASLLIELLVVRRVRSQGDVMRLYPLPVLARVPEMLGAEGRRGERTESSLAASEAYRALRTQLELRAPRSGRERGDRRGSIVVVTSNGRGEGKTTTVIGLAHAVARTERSVLMMDFDLGEPSLVPRMGASPARDLASLLPGDTSLADLATSVDGAEMRAVAAPSGADAAIAERLFSLGPDLLRQARSIADWVIVDSPPLTEAGDALSIAAGCDFLVLVSRLGHTPESALAGSRDLLETVDIEPAGHVLIGGRFDDRHADRDEPRSFRLGDVGRRRAASR